ncbi:MAG: carbohydrate ABC transporter permease [Clostridiaceae bacterium]
MKIHASVSDRLLVIINYTILSIVLLLISYPLIYTLSASISNPISVSSGKMWLWPVDISFEGFKLVFENDEIWLGYRNTLLYTIVGTLFNLLMTIPCAYALAQKKLPGRGLIMRIFMFTMYFGGGLIPTYFLMRDLNLIDKPLAMIIPSGASVMNIIIARTFFVSTIPAELEDSAEIDGCSPLRCFIRIVVPLSKSIIAIIALYYAVGHWNSYFNAMIYLSNRKYFPLQLFLREILIDQQMILQMMESGGADDSNTVLEQMKMAETVKYATMIVSSLPLLAAYPFLQRYFVKGLMIGSIKG